MIAIKHRVTGDVLWQGTDLEDANLQGANLQGANLRGANLRGANLERANLERANLQDANLQGTNLQGTNLRDASLRDASLRDANLRDANLRGTNLEGTNLEVANLWDSLVEAGWCDLGVSDYTLRYNIETGLLWAGCFMGTIDQGLERWDRDDDRAILFTLLINDIQGASND
jgi:uncharacterized protein YjbI with pentapeptide repeats